MPLLKTADQLMEQGQDRLLRGDFRSAQDRFSDAAGKYSKDGNLQGAVVAKAYASLMAIGAGASVSMTYRNAAAALGPLGDMPMKLGPRQVPASYLAREASLLAEEMELLGSRPENAAGHAVISQRLQALSLAYRQLGTATLILPETFTHESISPSQKAPAMAALSEEEMGESLVATDPKRAAEHNQNARNWWVQAGDPVRAQAAAGRVDRYGRSVKCWFCGREVTGEGLQFVQLPGDIGPWSTASSGSALESTNAASNTVYACRGCQSVVDKVADKWAVQRSAEVEARLNEKIEQLRRRIPGG
jgi:hypothetical protein